MVGFWNFLVRTERIRLSDFLESKLHHCGGLNKGKIRRILKVKGASLASLLIFHPLDKSNRKERIHITRYFPG